MLATRSCIYGHVGLCIGSHFVLPCLQLHCALLGALRGDHEVALCAPRALPLRPYIIPEFYLKEMKTEN